MAERLGIFISGGGTTAAAISEAVISGKLPGLEIGCLIASTPSAGGIDKLVKLGFSAQDIVVVNPDDFRGGDKKVDEWGFGLALLKPLRERGITVVTQNGWMPHTPENVIEAFPDTIFNQHPGPVPEFGGKGMFGRRVHAAVLMFKRWTRRDLWTKAIAQRVGREFDSGVVVKAQRVDILRSDTTDDLQKRVLPKEHEVQIALLGDVVSGRVQEITRESALVLQGEESKLMLSKLLAQYLYPEG